MSFYSVDNKISDAYWKFVEKTLDELEKQLNTSFSVSRCLELDADSPLTEPLYTVTDLLVDSIEATLGDTNNWVSFYVFDCDFGKSPKEVAINIGEDYEDRHILSTTKVLRYLIENEK